MRDRNEASFRAVYARTTPSLLGLAMRLCGGDRSAAEDVVQEAWFRAVRGAARYTSGRPVARWLSGIVANCWREQSRASWREGGTAPAELDRLAVDSRPLWSESPVLARAVAALPDGYRAVLVLHDIEGYSHAEIARLLDIEEGTSKSQLSRARRQLRARLGARDADGARVTGSDNAR